MLHTAKYLLLIASCVVGLSACSGGNQVTDGQSGTAQSKQLGHSQKTNASPYQNVVEQLYVAYFGRPADPTGLTNFEAQLAASNAPTDIQALVGAYGTNATVKALIDGFGNSVESQRLYGNSNHTTFVQAVFNNVLGRQPASAGLNFWVSALDNGSITYGDAALSIMAGALVNTTAQGLIDAKLVANRISVAIEFTSEVTTQNAVADYSGSTAAAAARNMLSQVNSNTNTSSFQTTVNSTVAALIPTTSVNNVAAISVDSGVPGVTSIDEPFTSVTICDPANPGNCQTIDHILVDTGSYGLRVIYSTLNSSIASALSAQGSTNVLVECTQFVDGYTWGPVRNVNFSIAGETVNNMHLQVIGDPAFAALGGIGTTCNNGTTAENTVSDFGSNGVIGVGLFQQDCGNSCVTNADNGNYYTCSTTSCVGSKASLIAQVQNPVSLFASDNNGVIVSLPAAPQAGENTASGTLTFGVGTQSNNALGSASVFQMNNQGNFSTTFGGTLMKNSFIDSGSNGLYFPNVTNIATCSDGFYCPSSPITLTATMTALNNSTSVNNTQDISFTIANVDDALSSAQAQNYAVFVPLGAPNSDSSSFDWGLPFFFGRNVIVVTENKTVGGNTGPFVAF